MRRAGTRLPGEEQGEMVLVGRNLVSCKAKDVLLVGAASFHLQVFISSRFLANVPGALLPAWEKHPQSRGEAGAPRRASAGGGGARGAEAGDQPGAASAGLRAPWWRGMPLGG